MGKRFSICVGIDDYHDMSNLEFCVKDADDVSELFVTFCNVDAQNTRCITSTKSRPQSSPWKSSEDTIFSLKSEFIPNEDDLLFYFSGHGLEGTSTTVYFKNIAKNVWEILAVINELNPKTKILFFDSCYSGSGFEESERSASAFTQATKSSFGVFIIASCSKKQTAKESKVLKNGKFTSFLIEIVSDKQNYANESVLDINTLYSKLNTLFFEDPKNDQTPFIQQKLVAGYPLANGFNEGEFYVRFTANDTDSFDWSKILKSLNAYLSVSEEMMGEFFSLIREQVSNTLDSRKGNASNQIIEIAKNRVVLIDDGMFFDLFSPPTNIKGRGGIETASYFEDEFKGQYSYNCSGDPGLNQYLFTFPLEDYSCSLNVDFHELTFIDQIIIPPECPFYTLRFKKHTLIISMSYEFAKKFTKIARMYNKKIIFEIPENPKLFKHLNEAFKQDNAEDCIEIKVYL